MGLHQSRLQTRFVLSRYTGLFAVMLSGLISSCGSSEADQSGPTSHEAARRRTTTQLSIATYNVENFWDDDNENSDTVYEDYEHTTSNWLSSKMYLKKAKQVARALEIAGAPDIVCMQEIESGKNKSRSLEIMRPELEKLGYKYFALGLQQEYSPTAVTTAVVSKYPIVSNTNLDFGNDESSRDPQVVTVEVAGSQLRIYNSHWKSKRGKDPRQTEPARMSIAKLIKKDIDLVRTQNPNVDILVTGDFNSEYNESELEAGPSGIVEGLGATGDVRQMLRSTRSKALYNLWFELPVEKRCSYSFNGVRGCIDNLLVSDTLFDTSGFQLMPKSLRIVGLSGKIKGEQELLNADGTPLRWQQRKFYRKTGSFTQHLGTGFSDHLPIVADFQVFPNNQSPTKIVVENPSTTPRGPNYKNKDIVWSCTQEEGYLDLKKVDFSTAKARNHCFQLTAGNFELYKADQQSNVGVRINGHELKLSLARARGDNAVAMKQLRKMIGSKLVRIEGRIGWFGGELAIFADSLADIKLDKPIADLGKSSHDEAL